MMHENTILHIPHSAIYIPEDIKNEFLISHDEIKEQQLLITDRYTDELYDYEGVLLHKNEVSRIVFDPERFRCTEDELMEEYGMGAFYTKTLDGKAMRNISDNRRGELLKRFYDPYHKCLTDKTAGCLSKYDKCLIIDGHSFPSLPLPFEKNKKRKRPDICIGADRFHTPKELVELIQNFAISNGYTVDINHPFAGALVPLKYYRKDKRVVSVMIEINRKLYMNETSDSKNKSFQKTRTFIHDLMRSIIKNT